MYQKSALAMMLMYLCVMLTGAGICAKGIVGEKKLAQFMGYEGKISDAFRQLDNQDVIVSRYVFEEEERGVGAGNLEIQVEVLEKKYCICLSETDYDTLLKIVEAEAGGEDETGKLLVANVVINRVKSSKFPNSVQEVVYQQERGVSQFTPVSDGRINTVKISETTKAAVEQALLGSDISQGALYFVNRKAADPDRMKWFDEHLCRLFCYGGHEFFL